MTVENVLLKIPELEDPRAEDFEKLGLSVVKGPNWFIVQPSKSMLNEQKKLNGCKSKEKHCAFCGIEFDYGIGMRYCGLCVIYIQCARCSTYFNKTNIGPIKDDVLNGREAYSFCTLDCYHKHIKEAMGREDYCITCGKLSIINNVRGKCSECYSKDQSRSGKIAASKIGKTGICNKCGKLCIIADVSGSCAACLKIQSAEAGKIGGAANASKIGTIQNCSTCGKLCAVVECAGRCLECVRKTSSEVGQRMASKVGTVGKCGCCGEIKVITNCYSLCKECNELASSLSGKRSASKIGTTSFCSRCGKSCIVADVAGMCKDCSGLISQKVGLKNAAKIGTTMNCSTCGKGCTVVNINGQCFECASAFGSAFGKIWGKENASLIGTTGKCATCGQEKVIATITHQCYECACLSQIRASFKRTSRSFDTLKEMLDSISIGNESFKVKVLEKDILNYKNVCGAIGLTGVYKGDGTNLKDLNIGKRFSLTAGKSINLYKEITRFLKILAQPEKQIPFGDPRDERHRDYGRWFDITHFYTDFEITIIAEEVSEIEAIAAETKWALENDAIFKFDLETHQKIPETHGYWMF